jgi:ketosteroid isomerase-like protein
MKLIALLVLAVALAATWPPNPTHSFTATLSLPMTSPHPNPDARNKQVVDNFFVALKTENFAMLKEVFAPDGRQLNPYVPEGFPKSFDGAEAIYKQYSSLPQNFGKMRFPRTIYGTDDPDFLFVVFKGDIDIKAGGKYQNDYLGTFRLERGRIKEYTEYFNPLVMARAFNIELK